jgi:hypothetical protein
MGRSVTIGAIGAGVVWLVIATQSVFAEPSAAPVTAPSSGSEPLPISHAASIEALWNEVSELRRKVEKPPKDVWDKFSSVSGFASGLAVALIGFYATTIYNKRQRDAEENRKNQAAVLEQAKFEFQTGIEKEKLGIERRKWRNELSIEVTLKLLEARLIEYSSLWTSIQGVATHRMKSGELTKDSARELARDVEKWRYSKGGLLAEPLTRDAAFVFQTAVWDFDGTRENYRHIRDARRILRDALRADMGVHEVGGKSLIDVAADRITADLAELQDRLGITEPTEENREVRGRILAPNS